MKRIAVAPRSVLVAVVLTAFLGGCVGFTPFETARRELGRGRFVEVGDGLVHVEDTGDGPAVVLLHGFGASTYSWRDVSADLVAGGYRVLAIDLHGFGLTRRPRERAAYSRFAQGEMVIGVLDALGIERAHLVGHSYGGSISSALAARAPERFSSLTLVDSAAPDYPRQRRSLAASVRPLAGVFVRLNLRRGRVREGLQRSTADDSIVTEELVDAYHQRLTIEGTPRAFWGLTAPLRDPQGEVELADIELPTLLVWGSEDTLITADSARRAARVLSAYRFVELPGIGHLPMEESPAALAQVLRRYFDDGLEAFPEPAANDAGGSGSASTSSR